MKNHFKTKSIIVASKYRQMIKDMKIISDNISNVRPQFLHFF